MSFDYAAVKQKVLKVAMQSAKKSASYSQQHHVLDQVASEFGGNPYTKLDPDLQQAIVTCWHDLFREGTLSWGYDLDNPDPPFFHIPDRTNQRK
jgi:hypothetical protein